MAEIGKIRPESFRISRYSKTAILFGSSGLVGHALLKAIVTHQAYTKLITFGRSDIKATHPKLQHYKIDFENLDKYQHLFKGNDLYISIGTTMKKAGSKDAFRKVDFDLVFMIAKLASLNGMDQLMLVSSVGADPESLFFYSRVKGDLEEAVRKLPFWAVHIFRPSLLLGERDEKRFGEQLAVNVMGRLKGFKSLFGKYQPIEPAILARAMVQAAQEMKRGTFIYESPELEMLGEKES